MLGLACAWFDGGDHHDPPAPPARDHVPRRFLRHRESAAQVDTVDAVPLGVGDVEERRALDHAGVANDDADAAERLDRLAHHRSGRRGIAEVAANDRRSPAERRQRTRQRLRRLPAAIPVQRHVGALRGEHPRDRLAHPLAVSTGNQRGVGVQPH
jgi:hypothetical protein